MPIETKALTVSKAEDSEKKIDVEFLIDSGAVYSVVPAPPLEELGIKPQREKRFYLADGTPVSRKVGNAFFQFQKIIGAAPVIFGEVGDQPLLGATTNKLSILLSIAL